MNYNENKALEFSKRLNAACDRKEIPVRGRAGYLRKKLPFDISLVAIRKWLVGEAIPDTKRLADIAEIVGSTVEELLGGQTKETHAINENVSPIAVENTHFVKARLVPLISWVQAGQFCPSDTQVLPQDCEMIMCPSPNASEQTYALRVVGDSMTAPHGRSYPEGMIIFVDKKKVPEVGKRVVARTQKGYTFKQLAENEYGEWYLKALNPQFPPIVEDNIEIDGVVIGSYDPE
ncbi:LexA family protein [Methylophaga sp.]|uniref:LexA family protein n=1 Tax=Methylophaga sp. TaxID=2024840 RepID=UPI003A8F517B